MNKLMMNSVIRLLMGMLSFWLASKGFEQGTIDNLNSLIVSLLAGGGVAGLALAWSAKDKKAGNILDIDPIAEPEKVVFKEPTILGKGFSLSDRSKNNMVGLHPHLIEILETAIIDAPYDFTVIEGLRNVTRQKALKDAGKSLTMKSLHLVQPDGYGHAFDLGYIHDGILDGDYNVYHELNEHIQAVSERLGYAVKWGGSFKRANGKPFIDAGHWQLD